MAIDSRGGRKRHTIAVSGGWFCMMVGLIHSDFILVVDSFLLSGDFGAMPRGTCNIWWTRFGIFPIASTRQPSQLLAVSLLVLASGVRARVRGSHGHKVMHLTQYTTSSTKLKPRMKKNTCPPSGIVSHAF